MKSKFNWVMTLLLALFIQISFAQEKTITGTVVSKTDKTSIPGVNVVVKGTKRGVQTDFNGEFAIKASVGEKLEISSLGFKSQVVTVGASNKLSIVLEDDMVTLDEVVTEGYSKTRVKSQSNVASATISSKTIEGRPSASFLPTLQGQVAGLQIGTESGQPGGSNYVLIRGSGTINGEDEPLYVIDGTPMSGDNFRSINPDEIDSISVLKDAGATSVYGNRGSNGVIIVKTKKANFGSAMSIRYVGSTGFSELQDVKLDMMNSQQLLSFEKANGVGSWPNLSDEEIANASTTDWRDTFFRTGITQSHTLSIASGSANLASSSTFGYFNQQGSIQNSDIQRFTYRNNLNGKSANDRFTYATNLSLNFSRNNQLIQSGGTNIFFNPIWSAFYGHPYLSPSMYTSGEDLWNAYGSMGTVLTPLTLYDFMKYNGTRSDEFKGIANLEGSYKIVKNLTFTSNLGVDYTQVDGYTFYHPDSFIGWANSNNIPDLPRGRESQNFSKVINFDFVNKLNYNKKFGEKHTFDATAFFEYIKAHSQGFGYSYPGINPKQAVPQAGIGYIPDDPNDGTLFVTASTSKAETGLLSYFGTFDYDYDNRFGAGLTLRRDASSRFATTNRWGTFYSVTGRWNIDREKFMEGSAFSMLKLRGSIGTNGNQLIAGSVFGGLNDTRELYDSSNGYGTYYGNQSYVVTQIANTDLKWESTRQIDFGVDFEVFNRRLSGTVDVYEKKATDLLQNVPISLINATSSLNMNYGDMTNRGVELTLRYDVIKNMDGFNLKLNGNIAYNKNNMVDVANPEGFIDYDTQIVAEGHPAYEYYTIRYAGVNPANGNLLYLDKAGNPTENPSLEDRVYTGKTLLPKYQGGFGFDAEYKGFYLNTQFNYAMETYKFNYDLYWAQNAATMQGIFNMSTEILDAWTPTNLYTDIPAVGATNTALQTNSDRYLKDASYLRLRYTNFGYSFSKKDLAKTPFKGFKVYCQAENLFTWAKWRGLDVQAPSSASVMSYPTSKIVSMGLQIEF